MMARSRHLHDDRLYECYLAERAGVPPDPPAAEHLADCRTCRTRYAEFSALLEEVRREADAESNEIFTPARLHQQQDHILRRIAHVNRAARIISFPGRVAEHISIRSGHIPPRWMAAAAAIGLFVGGAVGGVLIEPHLNHRTPDSEWRVTNQLSPAPRPASEAAVLVSNPAPAADAIDDDAFLMELEIALEHPQTRELRPFDALTPHVHEVDARVP